MSKSQYRLPLVDGRVKVTLWDNYVKHKFDKPDLWWMEFVPIRIFPDIWGPFNTDDDEIIKEK
jgi:hypothetical protein